MFSFDINKTDKNYFGKREKIKNLTIPAAQIVIANQRMHLNILVFQYATQVFFIFFLNLFINTNDSVKDSAEISGDPNRIHLHYMSKQSSYRNNHIKNALDLIA